MGSAAPPRGEHRLITPDGRQIWRPIYAFGAIAIVIAVVGLVAAGRGSSDAWPVTIFCVTVCLGTAGARILIWWALPGRVTVSHDDSGLIVRRGRRLLRHYPWSHIRRVDVSYGDRWPEWGRTALFPRLRVERSEQGSGHVDWSPSFLLVRPSDVEEARRRLEGVVQRYVRS